MGNRYLEGNYGPVADEVTAFDLEVIGELPPELEGRYLRNGPNPLSVPDEATHHWFAGDGMVHGVRLRGGRAEWYRNRYVGSKRLSEIRHQPDIPGPNWNDAATGPNTNAGGFAGTTWAMVEAGGCPVEMTYELGTVARNDFFGTLPGAFTAHPKVDPDTGELHAVAYAWAQWMDHVQYLVVAPDGKVRRTVDIGLPGMTMLHDMSLTGRYVVVYDQPVTVDLDLAFAGRFPFRWDPGYGNRLGLLPREGGADDIVWVDAPLCYAYHPMNAYDQADGTVVIDLCVYDRMFDTDVLGPFGDCLPRLERWVVDPVARTMSATVVDERPNEFPRHRGSLTGKPYRYGYCASPDVSTPTSAWTTLKHDLQTGTRQVFDHGPGRAAGEAVFVGRAGGADEDHGWLLAFVHDLGTERTELAVWDAQDFGRGYVGRVLLPQRVPFGFHGNWVSDSAVPPVP
ncbi:MAG: carotenoid oxygenase family protein [Acidimicrobiia bacterium]|nr:carotenoid oxygenase family protein [Acidimicrobiia bacterium]MDH5291371.1 carotenoid oxygenase family protein [Acidimicrobiia bacterium]